MGLVKIEGINVRCSVDMKWRGNKVQEGLVQFWHVWISHMMGIKWCRAVENLFIMVDGV